MTSNTFSQFWSDGDDHGTESHQRQDSPGAFSSQFQRADRETLIRQAQRLYTAEQERNTAVLKRLGLSIQQDPLSPPQPPAGPRQRPESSVTGRSLRRVVQVPHVSNGWASRTQRQKWSPETQDEEVEEVHLWSDQSSLSSVDLHTPDQLRAIGLIASPVEVSPPQTPVTRCPPPPRAAVRRSRRVSLLPVMSASLSGADKEVVSGCRIQTAKHQLEAIHRRLENFRQNQVIHLPQPLKAPRSNTGARPFAPAPPPKPAPPRNTRTCHGTFLCPIKTVSGGKKTDNTCNLEELQPLCSPVEGLSLCLKLLSSEDWEKKIEGLQSVQALAQHDPDVLMVKLHQVCLAVIAEVKNLRSSMACAAMDTLVYLYVYLQRYMDTQVEGTGRALLLKIAQSHANIFVQQQANVALAAMVQNCSPRRVLNVLLNTGLSHLSAAVRASTAQQLHSLADILGPDAVFSKGKTFTKRFLGAVCKISMDAAAEVRPHGHAILQSLALHRDFMNLWKDIVADKHRRPLERILRNAKKESKWG